jgi:hypothetical protein
MFTFTYDECFLSQYFHFHDLKRELRAVTHRKNAEQTRLSVDELKGCKDFYP